MLALSLVEFFIGFSDIPLPPWPRAFNISLKLAVLVVFTGYPLVMSILVCAMQYLSVWLTHLFSSPLGQGPSQVTQA